LTSWAHLLTARQPRCDHWSALPRAPWPYQLRDKKIPSPSRGANILKIERSELTKRGAFSIPRSRQSPANGFLLASPSVTSYRLCAPYLVHSLRSAAIVPHGCSAEEAEAGR